ncbi:amino acid deaminase [uncultured Pseudacidovorax sp.]|uniref:amino acid deaminase n=1 Tax=uncultured Pseudacidovorax sp. TaxID=679313 RepID=UPI0025F9DDF2|nr:amino acid deaminase [uncultured Pseudacidovorax sp.]
MTTDLTDPLLDGTYKGYPRTQAPRPRSSVGSAGWNVLAGDLPLPLALIKREQLAHNLAWMQRYAQGQGIDMAPHGKTTMSPQLFARQLDAGAWGITFANVAQLAIGAAAGVRNALIANQVVQDEDLAGIQQLQAAHAGLRVVFLVDSQAQLALIAGWAARHAGARPFEVMLEIGVDGGRTGCRTHEDALALARAVYESPAARLVGIECYEGQGATGQDGPDTAYATALMDRVQAVAEACVAERLFEADELLFSAGGSAIFDLVAGRLRPALGRPVRGLLRSGCYVTHDHGFYTRMVGAVNRRLGCDCGEGLQPAMEVWAAVQSRPEPRLAILTVGRRDISFDLSLPVPIARAVRGAAAPQAVPVSWQITALNDQHAYLRWEEADDAAAPVVGERVGLGISHPCTTFDKWRWMPVVDANYTVVDAITTHF